MTLVQHEGHLCFIYDRFFILEFKYGENKKKSYIAVARIFKTVII